MRILLQAETKRRQGVSQYKQPHIMLQKGLDLLEELFPGYKSELAKAGALDVDLLEDIIFVMLHTPPAQRQCSSPTPSHALSSTCMHV